MAKKEKGAARKNRLRHTQKGALLRIVGVLALCAFCGALTVLETRGYYRRLGLENYAFWRNYISPLGQAVRENFINLYVSQISTTFLITAFLSLLGDKGTPLYWTTAMDFKLIYPKGSSLTDLTAYSFCTLAISLVAILLQVRVCFLFSFLINICFLVFITWRMLMVFYQKAAIKSQLKKKFKKETEKQEARIGIIEETMHRAAHDHDVEYLRECKDFFAEFITEEAINAFQKDMQEVCTLISELNAISQKCTAYRNDKAGATEAGNKLGKMVLQEGEKAAASLRKKFTEIYEKLPAEQTDNIKSKIATLVWDKAGFQASSEKAEIDKQLAHIAAQANRMAETAKNPLWVKAAFIITSDICNHISFARMLRCLEIIPHQFIHLHLSGIQSICRGIGMSGLVDQDPSKRETHQKNHVRQALSNENALYNGRFPIVFILRMRVVKLLQQNIREATLSEAAAAWGLDTLLAFHLTALESCVKECYYSNGESQNFNILITDFVDCLHEAYVNHKSLNPYIKAIVTICTLIESGLQQLYKADFPDAREKWTELAKGLDIFTEEDAKKLFACVCSKNALYNDHYEVYELLQRVCAHTKNKSDTLKSEITEAVKAAPQLGDDREYILTFLDN